MNSHGQSTLEIAIAAQVSFLFLQISLQSKTRVNLEQNKTKVLVARSLLLFVILYKCRY